MIVEATRGSDRWLFLIGGVAAIVGSLIGMVGNLIHPDTPIGDPAGVALAIAQSETWLPIHLAIVLGIILMFGGLVALAYSVRGDLAVALARLALAAAIAGVAVGLVLVILDGVAARQLAEDWAAAPAAEQATALRILAANETMQLRAGQPVQHPVRRRRVHPVRARGRRERGLSALAGPARRARWVGVDRRRPRPG